MSTLYYQANYTQHIRMLILKKKRRIRAIKLSTCYFRNMNTLCWSDQFNSDTISLSLSSIFWLHLHVFSEAQLYVVNLIQTHFQHCPFLCMHSLMWYVGVTYNEWFICIVAPLSRLIWNSLLSFPKRTLCLYHIGSN